MSALTVALLLAGCAGATWGETAPQRNATVVEVVDGDTLDVRFADGSRDTVRLVGVDTPEVHVEVDPAEFEGVPDTDAGRACLRAAGEEAGRFVRRSVLGARVRITPDPRTDRRDAYGRLLAYVARENRSLNYRLVARGHARVYDSTFSRSERFYAAESRAMNRGAGVWACREP